MIERSATLNARKTLRPLLGSAFALCGLAFVSGCADATVIDPNLDSSVNTTTDGGTTTKVTKYSATPAVKAAFDSNANNPTYQQWKRDPHFVTDSNDQYLFASGSSFQTEAWNILYYKQTGGAPTSATSPTLALAPRAGQWDSLDLTAPHVRIGTGASKFTLYYAANGDATKPSFVTQIGVATSSDGTNWTRGSAPALGVPAFDGTMNTSNPTTARPDAWGVTDPWVMTDNGSTVMYYAGLDCSGGTSCTFQIFRTTSSDNGVTFAPGSVVLSARQGIAEEMGGVAGPSVYYDSTAKLYTMAYTAVGAAVPRDRVGLRSTITTGTIGIATSTDGKTWTNAVANGNVLIAKGPGSYRGQGATSPSLYLLNGTALSMYFTGTIDQSGLGVFYSIGTASVTVAQ